MARSNRYPNRGAVARDYRRDRPSRWVPDNDNDPRWKRPRELPRKPTPLIPANDNRPVPKVSDWSYSRPPKIPGYLRWMRRILWIAGPLGWALTAWELYQLWQEYQQLQEPDYGAPVVCSARSPSAYPMQSFRYLNIVPTCQEGIRPVGDTSWSTQKYMTWWQGRTLPRPFSGQRWLPVETYVMPPEGPIDDEFPLDPKLYPRVFPQPKTDPWTRPPPWDEPFVEPGRPQPPVTPLPRYRTRKEPKRPPLPEDRVSEEPTFYPKPDWRTEPYPRKPRKRERERKLRIRDLPNERLRRTLGWLLSAASEGGDFLDIMYGALPKELQSNDADMAEKFQTVFSNLDKVDFDKFVSDLWQNEVSDRYFGKGFGDMSEALEDFGLELPSLKL